MENHISALRIIRQILRRDQKIARLRPDGHAVFIFRTEQRPPRRRRDVQRFATPALVDNRNRELPDPLGFQPFGCVSSSPIIHWR